jgi:hypothetical protein
MKLWFTRQIFEKYSTTKFHENPSSGSRVVPCGQTLFAILRTRQQITHRSKRNAAVRDERRRTKGINTDRARSVTGQLCSTDWGDALRFKWSVMWHRVDWLLQTLRRTRGLNQQTLLFSWLLDLEVKGSNIFRNVGNYLPVGTARHPKRHETSVFIRYIHVRKRIPECVLRSKSEYLRAVFNNITRFRTQQSCECFTCRTAHIYHDPHGRRYIHSFTCSTHWAQTLQ